MQLYHNWTCTCMLETFLVMSLPLEQGRLNLQVSPLVLLISALKLLYMFG